MTLAGSRGILTVPSLIVHVIWEITSINGVFDIRGMSVQKGEGMIIIDYKDTRPIYEQIVERFKTLILKGAMQADEQIPSVRSLAMELSINPNTIQKAYAELERQGFIYGFKYVMGLFTQDQKPCVCMNRLDESIKEEYSMLAVEGTDKTDPVVDILKEYVPEEKFGDAVDTLCVCIENTKYAVFEQGFLRGIAAEKGGNI